MTIQKSKNNVENIYDTHCLHPIDDLQRVSISGVRLSQVRRLFLKDEQVKKR